MDIVEFQTVFVAPVRNGIYKSKEFQGRGVRLVKMNQLFSERRLHSQADGYELIELTEKERQTLLLKKNDLLFSRTSVVADGVGKCSIIADVNEELTWDSNIIRVRLDPGKAYPQFYFYFFNSPDGRDVVKRLSSGAAVTTITGSGLSASHVPLPPLPVQQRIAGILSAYDELIENNQRRIRILEDMARSLYCEWFVRFRYPGHEAVPLVDSPLGQIPRGWEAVPLSSLVDFAKGRKPIETRQEAIPGDVRLLLIDTLRGGEPEFTSPTKIVLAETRDTIMVMDGASSCDVAIGFAGAVGSTLGRFRTTRTDVFSPHALYRFLEAKAEEFKSKNIGAAIPHANKDYILTQAVALPPKEIAASFHVQLEPIQSVIETLKAQIQNLRRTRDLLLPRLLSGQVSLIVPESEQDEVMP